MSLVLFLGPSLAADEARTLYGRDDLHLLPPAAQGDVLRALALAPRVIGLVDGRFDGVPAVLHKEILHALQHGVHVLGAASMGALRAAELHPFGMRGVGAIFEGYRDGRLVDDDAVALLHAGPEHGYRPHSEPLVDIDATLDAARRAGLIAAEAARRLHDAAVALEYGNRQWPALLQVLREHAEPPACAHFQNWLAAGRVHAKRDDARLLVEQAREMLSTDPAPFEADFELQPSHHWEDFRSRHENSSPGRDEHAVLDELRLDEASWRRLRDAALLRLLARREKTRQGIDDDTAVARAPLAALRRQHALTRRADLERWLRDAGMSTQRLQEALTDRAVIDRLCGLFDESLEAAVLTEAGLDGALPGLRRKAAAKHAVLIGAGEGSGTAPPPALLLEWFFGQQRGQPVPTDLDAHAASLGLRDSGELVQLLSQEYLYWRATNANEQDAGST